MAGNSNAISVRYAPVDGRRAAGQQKHDRRDPMHTPDYIDQSRSHLNTNKVERAWTAEGIRQEIAAERQAAGMQKLRADASTLVTGIVTFGHDAQTIIENMTRNEQDDILEKVINDQAKAAGHELLDWSVHRDEHATHAHFTLRGYSPEAKPWRKGILEMKQLQDVAAESVAHLGIERGNSKAARLASGENIRDVTHKSVKQLHEALPEEVAKLEAKLENLQRLYDQAQARLAAGAENEAALVKRLGVYEARIQKLEKQLASKPAPEGQVIEIVTGRKERFLRPDEIETKKVKAVPASAVEKWKTSFLDDINHERQQIREEGRQTSEHLKRKEKDLVQREGKLVAKQMETTAKEMKLTAREVQLNQRERGLEEREIAVGIRMPEAQKPAPAPAQAEPEQERQRPALSMDMFKRSGMPDITPEAQQSHHEQDHDEPEAEM